VKTPSRSIDPMAALQNLVKSKNRNAPPLPANLFGRQGKITA